MTTANKPTTGAVLLAGGRSSRMGQPKAWLDWGGKPLLTHLVELVHLSCTHIVVVGAPGQPLPDLPRATRVDDPPEHLGMGPLVGLHTGLQALAHRQVEVAFLGACDGVAMQSTHVEFVVGCLRTQGVDAVIPVDDAPPHYAHPLASAVVVDKAFAVTTKLLEQGVRRPVRLFQQLGALEVPASQLPDPGVLATCNTPQAYRAAYLARWGQNPPATG